MERKLICQNRKAVHDYIIEETFEAGLVLDGPEVKSLRDGKATSPTATPGSRKGEAYLYNMHISPYPFAHHMNWTPTEQGSSSFTKGAQRLMGKTEERASPMVLAEGLFIPRDGVKVELAVVKREKEGGQAPGHQGKGHEARDGPARKKENIDRGNKKA